MKFSPATDFGRMKIVLNPECKIVYTLWSKNISHRFSLRKIPVKKGNKRHMLISGMLITGMQCTELREGEKIL